MYTMNSDCPMKIRVWCANRTTILKYVIRKKIGFNHILFVYSFDCRFVQFKTNWYEKRHRMKWNEMLRMKKNENHLKNWVECRLSGFFMEMVYLKVYTGQFKLYMDLFWGYSLNLLYNLKFIERFFPFPMKKSFR